MSSFGLCISGKQTLLIAQECGVIVAIQIIIIMLYSVQVILLYCTAFVLFCCIVRRQKKIEIYIDNSKHYPTNENDLYRMCDIYVIICHVLNG